MRCIPSDHSHVVAPLAALTLTAAVAVAQAQTVMPPSAAANCVQNAGNGELACGSGATANPGTGATAVGINAKATADAAMAFGSNANASAISAMAFGLGAAASQQGSIAIGQGATSSGAQSTAVGFAARAFGNDSVAVGDTCQRGKRERPFQHRHRQQHVGQFRLEHSHRFRCTDHRREPDDVRDRD